MSEYVAKLSWSLGEGELAYGKYSTNHRMTFSGGLSAIMTSAPEYGGDTRYVNPEEALPAALSSRYTRIERLPYWEKPRMVVPGLARLFCIR